MWGCWVLRRVGGCFGVSGRPMLLTYSGGPSWKKTCAFQEDVGTANTEKIKVFLGTVKLLGVSIIYLGNKTAHCLSVEFIASAELQKCKLVLQERYTLFFFSNPTPPFPDWYFVIGYILRRQTKYITEIKIHRGKSWGNQENQVNLQSINKTELLLQEGLAEIERSVRLTFSCIWIS